ncbi:MAG: hypothetical protein ABIT04_06605 [Novosphingobium sp.]
MTVFDTREGTIIERRTLSASDGGLAIEQLTLGGDLAVAVAKAA